MSIDLNKFATSRPKPVRKTCADRSPEADTTPPQIDHATRARETTRLLRLASDPTRLRLLTSLMDGRLNVTEICGILGKISQQAISHHLALIRVARLVESQRDGKFNYYMLTDDGRKLINAIARIWE